jgi:hypothetical protein
VIGGIDQWAVLTEGRADDALAQARDALEQTGGRGVILGGGCVLPMGTSDATLVSLLKSLGGIPKLGFLRPQ